MQIVDSGSHVRALGSSADLLFWFCADKCELRTGKKIHTHGMLVEILFLSLLFLLLFGLSAAIKPVKASNRGDFWMVVNSATSNWIMSEYEREAEKRVQMATFISFSFCPGISLTARCVGIFNLSYPNSSSQEFHYYVLYARIYGRVCVCECRIEC